MARRSNPTHSTLGRAMRERRGAVSVEEAAPALGISAPTMYRLERGTHRPSADTALALARWLGWTMEQIMQAADQPAPTDVPSQEP